MKARIISFILLAMLFSSCGDEFITLTPTESIEAEQAITTPEKVNAILIGAYDRLQYSYYVPLLILNNDVKGEDVFVRSSGNYGRLVENYKYNDLTNYYWVDDIWEYSYKTITNVNLIINGLDNIDMDQAKKTQLIAEAKGLRGFAYLVLIQCYAKPYSIDPTSLGVPLITKTVTPSDPGAKRASVKEVYDLIISDLTFASENLEMSDNYRITGAATKGLLARAYLNMKNWTEASKWAQAARKDYPLMSGEEWLNGFKSGDNTEWMWCLRSTEEDSNGYLHVASFYDAARQLGYNSFRLDRDFVAKFATTDIRRQSFHNNGANYSGGAISLKFDHVSGWKMDQVLMRASEMYLIEAEAEAELGAGHETAAQNALYAIQSRADETVVKSTKTGQALIDEILLERRKELYGEGFRWFDLNRRGLPVVRTSASHWVPLNMPIDDYRRIFPIPQGEMDANPNMVQNPGHAN